MRAATKLIARRKLRKTSFMSQLRKSLAATVAATLISLSSHVTQKKSKQHFPVRRKFRFPTNLRIVEAEFKFSRGAELPSRSLLHCQKSVMIIAK